jgi:hypothetical protein
LKHGHVIPISYNLNLNNSTSTSGSRSIFDHFPEYGTSDPSVIGEIAPVKMGLVSVGNGKAPFGHEGEEEVKKEVQEEDQEVGKGKWGSVEMVTYNSLTVDPVLGKLFGSSLSWSSFWLDLDIVLEPPRLILDASCVALFVG